MIYEYRKHGAVILMVLLLQIRACREASIHIYVYVFMCHRYIDVSLIEYEYDNLIAYISLIVSRKKISRKRERKS